MLKMVVHDFKPGDRLFDVSDIIHLSKSIFISKHEKPDYVSKGRNV